MISERGVVYRASFIYIYAMNEVSEMLYTRICKNFHTREKERDRDREKERSRER